MEFGVIKPLSHLTKKLCRWSSLAELTAEDFAGQVPKLQCRYTLPVSLQFIRNSIRVCRTASGNWIARFCLHRYQGSMQWSPSFSTVATVPRFGIDIQLWNLNWMDAVPGWVEVLTPLTALILCCCCCCVGCCRKRRKTKTKIVYVPVPTEPVDAEPHPPAYPPPPVQNSINV